jgi:hypothetical protein
VITGDSGERSSVVIAFGKIALIYQFNEKVQDGAEDWETGTFVIDF